MAKLKGMVIEV
jgi:hypothetical protein